MAKNISKIKGKKGITLVECVVAIAIFAIMSYPLPFLYG